MIDMQCHWYSVVIFTGKRKHYDIIVTGSKKAALRFKGIILAFSNRVWHYRWNQSVDLVTAVQMIEQVVDQKQLYVWAKENFGLVNVTRGQIKRRRKKSFFRSI